MGFKRKYYSETRDIWKENIEKNLWTDQRINGLWRIKTNEELETDQTKKYNKILLNPKD